MKKILAISSILTVFILSAAAQITTARLDEIMTAFTALEKFNGSVLVAKKGQVLLEKGYGWKNIKDSTRNDDKTIYQIGSVTKQFTSAIIMKLVEQKKLAVTHKLSKYYPDYPKGDSITIHNLLTHTSGIYNYTNDGKFMNSEIAKPQTEQKMISLFRDRPLDFSPGSKYSYSNSGYSLLGYIIVKVTGKSWEQNMRELILTPLRMQHSGFNFTSLKSPDKATGYFFLGAKGNQPAPIVDSTVAYSAGSLYSTVGDLYRWERSIYTNKILTADSWKKTFTPFLSKYAYGWSIDTLFDRNTTAHSGGIHGFNSYLLRFPEEELVVILIANKPTPAMNAISHTLAAASLNLPYEVPKEKVATTISDEKLATYVGTYQMDEGLEVFVELENHQLKSKISGQKFFDLFPEKEDRFFLKVVEATVEFVKGTDGKVNALIINQNGRSTTAKKIK
ncbi:MAG: serine hydrolase [Chitinophagaceae bacterium]|nr:serine hydrolase [Chitinophagaceae bacterium]